MLEKELETIDQKDSEDAPLFLGKSRCDGNSERIRVLSEIDTALADYGLYILFVRLYRTVITKDIDAMVGRNNKMLSYEPAKLREVLSLQNWVNGKACLAREETEYLKHCKELISVASLGDGTVDRLEAWMEDKLVYFCTVFGKVRIHTVCRLYVTVEAKPEKGPRRDISRDPNVYIFSGSFAAQAGRALIAISLVFFLLAPVIICNSLGGLKYRTIVVAVATVFLVATLAWLTKVRTVEMVVAGTT
jgi:hypothetical protein